MSDLFDISTLLSALLQYVYVIPAIFQVVVSNTAKRRHPGSASRQMVTGSVLSLAVSLCYLGMNVFTSYTGDYSFYEWPFLYAGLNVLGLLGTIIFLVGLNNFVKAYRGRDESSLLDRY